MDESLVKCSELHEYEFWYLLQARQRLTVMIDSTCDSMEKKVPKIFVEAFNSSCGQIKYGIHEME